MNIFTCGEEFIEFVKISLNSSKQFKAVSYCSYLAKKVTHDSLVKNVNHNFKIINLSTCNSLLHQVPHVCFVWNVIFYSSSNRPQVKLTEANFYYDLKKY